MSFLRRRPTCFYCSHQVSLQALRGVQQYPNGRPRRFTCPNCSADNHLDENGDIVDYIPDTPDRPAPVFARRRNSPRAIHSLAPRTTPQNPDDSPPGSPTFCRTCLHNQQIITNAIATYPLPPEDHPDYDEHVNYLFPQHQKMLEERWPPVCADCAPKVNDRIRTSNYQVKVASLGQMLARTSGYEAAAGGGGKKDVGKSSGKERFERVVWWVRGGVWCYFHLLMLVWHGSAMLQPQDTQDMDMTVGSWGSCIIRSVVSRDVDQHCYGIAARQAARWVPWSILSFFWIYRERDLQKHPHKKLVGAREYLKLECFVYIFRLLSWYLAAPGGMTFTEETFSRVHLGLFFLSVMTTLGSITCLKLEDPPSFSLREPEPIPSTPSPPSSPAPRRVQPRHPMSPVTPLRPTLNNPPPSTGSTLYSPLKFRARDPSPTPAPRRTPLSPDAMDWNPTESLTSTTWSSQKLPPPPQPSFTASFQSTAQQQRTGQYPSLFSGTLPAAPLHPSQRLVSLLQQPSKQQTPSSQLTREQFFTHRLNPTNTTPQGQQFSKVAAPSYRLGSPAYPPMAPQRFFVDDEATGLETLMGGGLKLDDEPVIVSVRVPEEAWVYVAARGLALLACIAALAWRGGGVVVQGVASAALAIVGLREGVGRKETKRSMWWMVGPAVLVAVLGASLVKVEEGKVRNGAGAAVVWALGREVWGMLMRMQRGRARAFYEDERKRSLEEEKEGRRREREDSVDSGSGRGVRGGSVGSDRGRKVVKREGSGLSFKGMSLS